MRKRIAMGLLLLTMVGVLLARSRARTRAEARSDAAACLTLKPEHRAACERAAERELKAGRLRASADYLNLACELCDPDAAEACNRLSNVLPKVTDGHCRVREGAGPDADNLIFEASVLSSTDPPLCRTEVHLAVPAGSPLPWPHGLQDGEAWTHAGMEVRAVHMQEGFTAATCHPIWFDGKRAVDVIWKWGGKDTHVGWLTFDHDVVANPNGFPADEKVLSHVEQHACELGADGIGQAARATGDRGPRFVLFRVPNTYRAWRKTHRESSSAAPGSTEI